VFNKLQQRLAWAQRAVGYVRGECRVSASNRGWIEWTGGVVTLRGLRLWAQRSGYPDLPPEQLVEMVANTARANGIGNCYEQSALAHLLLRNNARRWGPINWCAVTGHATGHGIVILGTLQGFCSDREGCPEGVKTRADGSWGVFPDRPNTWPTNAVICDPWRGVSYSAKEWNLNEPGRSVGVCCSES
jgi:hypothetical protein